MSKVLLYIVIDWSHWSEEKTAILSQNFVVNGSGILHLLVVESQRKWDTFVVTNDCQSWIHINIETLLMHKPWVYQVQHCSGGNILLPPLPFQCPYFIWVSVDLSHLFCTWIWVCDYPIFSSSICFGRVPLATSVQTFYGWGAFPVIHLAVSK